MNPQGLHVLIDGRNLEMPKGTGIKSYGLSLIKALGNMGAVPYVMFSKKARRQDPLIDTNIFGIFSDSGPKGSWIHRIRVASQACVRMPYQVGEARTVKKGLIITRGREEFEFINHVGTLSLPECYRMAIVLQMFGAVLRVKAKSRIDLWHATCPIPINFPGVPKITTMHDLIPLRLPYTTLGDKGFFVSRVRQAIKSSELLICVSESTKRDLMEFFDVRPEKIAVTYQTVALNAEKPSREEITQVLSGYNLEFQKYILFVGAIEPKKNLGRLIKAYLMLKTDLPLVVVGRKAWLYRQELMLLEQLDHLRKMVRLLNYVPSCELPVLYSGATCLVFPSLYEGFGLPPLEAMSFGCPVVTSNVSSLPETCGEAALYVDPYSPADIAQKLSTIIEDGSCRTRLSQAGLERAKFFSMEKYQERLLNAYSKVL